MHAGITPITVRRSPAEAPNWINGFLIESAESLFSNRSRLNITHTKYIMYNIRAHVH